MKKYNILKRTRAAVQRGVTLVELTIVLIIIGIIIAVLYTQIGGSDTDALRSSNLLRHMRIFITAADGQKETLGCYSRSTGGLFTADDAPHGMVAAIANNSCGVADVGNLAGTYNGPYIKGISYNGANDNIILDEIVGNARGEIQDVVSTAGGTNVWYRVNGIPDNIAVAVSNLCLGVAASTPGIAAPAGDATLAAPCILTDSTGADGVGLLIGHYQ